MGLFPGTWTIDGSFSLRKTGCIFTGAGQAPAYLEFGSTNLKEEPELWRHGRIAPINTILLDERMTNGI